MLQHAFDDGNNISLWCSYNAVISFVSALANCERHTFALFFFPPKLGHTRSHIRSCCDLSYSSGEMEKN